MCSTLCVFRKGVDQLGFKIVQPQASQDTLVEGRLRTGLTFAPPANEILPLNYEAGGHWSYL